jgi:hypothetical protein
MRATTWPRCAFRCALAALLLFPAARARAQGAKPAAGAGAEAGWTALFDGKSLDGWAVRGGKAAYRAEAGAIVGTTVEGSANTFLCKGPYKDFILEFEVKCDPRLNSGCQVRSHVYGMGTLYPAEGGREPREGVVYGPQCEIATNGTAGRFYDEGRRGQWINELLGEEAAKALRPDAWNAYRIVVQGDRYRSYVNGVACSDFRDANDPEGLIGLQVHAVPKGAGPYEVRWRNVRLRELKPGEDATSIE